MLPDGSRVWLNTASAFNRDFQPGLRRLHLVAGEILIETGTDKDRPFVVDTAEGRLRALGTRFTVRQEADATLLAVYQGAVEIRTARNAPGRHRGGPAGALYRRRGRLRHARRSGARSLDPGRSAGQQPNPAGNRR
ncbi:FecR domain-containing protein [Achromobacter insuavis]